MSEDLTNLERIIAKNPTSSLFARLADAYLKQGEVSRAIDACNRGLRYRPSYVSGHVVLGKSHFSAGMFEEARRSFNRALHLDPHHAVALWYLGQIDRAMGWDDLALRNYQKAQDLDPLSQCLKTGIDQILASISSTMDRRLQEELGAVKGSPDPGRDNDAPSEGSADAPLPVGAKDYPRQVRGPDPSGQGHGTHGDPPNEPESGDQDSACDGARRGGVGSETVADRTAGEMASLVSGSRGREVPGGKADEAARPEDSAAAEDLGIATATLAEMYAQQGHTGRAVGILQKVLEKEPGNLRARDRLDALRGRRPPSSPA